MTQAHESTESAKDDILAMKKDIKDLITRLGSLKGKGGDIMAEQLEHLSDAISDLKKKGEKKGKEMKNDLVSSTREHPLRNLACAFGLGALLSLILK